MTEKRPLTAAKRSRRKAKKNWDLHKRAIVRTFNPFFGWIDIKKAWNVPSVCRSNFQERYETVHNNWPLERFLRLTRALLLNIRGKCSCLRAMSAHFSGHLPVRLPPDEELVKMLIRPTERHLQDTMQLGNRAITPHEQTAPDLRADPAYPDAQLIDLDDLVGPLHLCSSSARSLFLHPTILASFALAQRRGTLCL